MLKHPVPLILAIAALFLAGCASAPRKQPLDPVSIDWLKQQLDSIHEREREAKEAEITLRKFVVEHQATVANDLFERAELRLLEARLAAAQNALGAAVAKYNGRIDEEVSGWLRTNGLPARIDFRLVPKAILVPERVSRPALGPSL